MNNILENKGDILLIELLPEIIGKIKFSGFSEELVGDIEGKELLKEFRITTSDGLFWSDWKILNDVNLSEDTYIVENSISIEVRYTLIETNGGTLEFNNIKLLGNKEEINFIAPTIYSNIFNEIIGSDCCKKIDVNLFKKLYYRGILPNYIKRGDNNDEKEDKDFIDLFSSFSKFFSMFICFFKRFENFKDDLQLMREQVTQYGIYFDESNVTLEELKYISQNLYNEIRRRGTEMIFSRKGDILKNGKEIFLDGEFIRLVRSKLSDELLYENTPTCKTGWCLGKSSPMYKGTAQAFNLNKTGENSKDFQDLENLVLNNLGESHYSLESFDDKKVLNLKSDNGKTGIGRIDLIENIDGKAVVVDSKMDYEITFAFRIINANSENAKLLFGCEGFDISKNRLNDSFVMPNGNNISEVFFEKKLNDLNGDCWYYARGIIHAYSSSVSSEGKTNLGFGTNLYFNNSFVKYIYPKIQLINDGESSELNIWDFKIRPLIRGTNIMPLKDGTKNSHSTGFIQSPRLFYTYVRNNNNGKNSSEIIEIIEKYLYPFNTTNMFIFMSNY